MTDEPVILTVSRWAQLRAATFLLMVGSAMVWAAIWLFQERSPKGVAVALVVLLPVGAVSIVVGLWALHGLIWAHRIEVSPSGLRLPRWKNPVAWSDLDPFTLVYQGVKFDWWLGRPVTVFRDAPPGRVYTRWAVRPGVPAPFFFSLTGHLSCVVAYEPVDLVGFLEGWRTRYVDRA